MPRANAISCLDTSGTSRTNVEASSKTFQRFNRFAPFKRSKPELGSEEALWTLCARLHCDIQSHPPASEGHRREMLWRRVSSSSPDERRRNTTSARVGRGAYWEDSYHATAVQADQHLHRCMVYIDLNMVRAGAVSHPANREGKCQAFPFPPLPGCSSRSTRL
jgi:hypothetical protein